MCGLSNKTRGIVLGCFVGVAIVLLALIMQIAIGAIPFALMSFSVGLFSLVCYVVLLVCGYLLRRKVGFFRWLGSMEAAISSIVYTAVVTLIMGLTKQEASPDGSSIFGFESMTSSWIFFMLYLWLTTVVGMVCIKRIVHFKWGSIPFLLNHLGLFFVLVFSLLGTTCRSRLTMTLKTGCKVNMALDAENRVCDLPFAIELNSFTLEEYVPKLVILDASTGSVLAREKFAEWSITEEKRIDSAVGVEAGDGVRYIAGKGEGTTFAVYVRAKNKKTMTERSGWVSCGSFLYPPEVLQIDDNFCLFMPEREPKRFASDVTVYFDGAQEEAGVIEVNNPMKIDGWFIYQLGYDKEKGRWSDISVLELVEDRWLPFVYAGILMMIGGAVCMFFLSNRNSRRL